MSIHDTAPPVKRKSIRPNDPPPNRVGVYLNGQRRAHVGVHAGVSVVSKLLGGAPASIGKVKGRTAWIATARTPSDHAVARRENAKLARSLRTDKGSNK